MHLIGPNLIAIYTQLRKPLLNSACNDSCVYTNDNYRNFCALTHLHDKTLGYREDYYHDSLRANVVKIDGTSHSTLEGQDGENLSFDRGVAKVKELAKSPILFLKDLYTCSSNQTTGDPDACTYTPGPLSPKSLLKALSTSRPPQPKGN
jgi:hypothetical protein